MTEEKQYIDKIIMEAVDNLLKYHTTYELLKSRELTVSYITDRLKYELESQLDFYLLPKEK